MQYRPLGKSSIKISEIGFGCMSLGKNEENTSLRLLHRAVDRGINFFDTADLYDKGANETTLGKAFRSMRKDLVLATKVGNQWRDDGSGWDWNPNKEYILKTAEESLKRLQTDYIDLYQLHGGTIEDPIDETVEAFELLKQQGKILQYGISSIRPNVIKEYVKRSFIVSVMMQYSLADRRPEEVFDMLEGNEISILARGVLAQGLLVDKPAKDYLAHKAESIVNIQKKLQELSSPERSTSQTAIQYVLSNPNVASAVVGIRTMEQLEEVTSNAQRLELQELNALREAITPIVYEQHRTHH
ncbi:MAG: aldo/keto reductase [Chitinophagaceae bacterium]|nr:aldo/keto reductase [Chitinophagaceae bacterium]